MKVNEPVAAVRTVRLRLTKDAGDGNGPQGVTGAASAAVLRIAAPGGNYGSTSATLTEITGGVDIGDYNLNLATTDVTAVGKWSIEVTNTGIIDPAHAFYDVEALDCLFYGLVTNAPDTTHVDIGSAVAQDGYYAKASTSRVCTVRVIAGAGAGQHRTGINYIAANHRLQIDEAFVVAVDTSSVIRLEQCVPTTALTTDARLANLDAAVSSRSTVSGILGFVLGTQSGINRTVQGVLRRMDWVNLGGGLGILSSVAKFFQYDGSTTAFQAAQNPTQGTRSAATNVAGD